MTCFFDVDQSDAVRTYRARETALAGWGPDHVSGPAVVGLLGQVLEDEQGLDGFLPARLTVELLRTFRTSPVTVATDVVRAGRRIVVARADATQNGHLVASATFVQYAQTENAPGQRWHADHHLPFPDESITASAPEATAWFHSESGGWTRDIGHHADADPMSAWWRTPQVTAGREPSPYVRAVTLAEWTSLVCHIGTDYVNYINGDLTVGLSRLPVGDWVGVQVASHLDAAGVAAGTSTLFDRQGPIGSGLVTALANPHP